MRTIRVAVQPSSLAAAFAAGLVACGSSNPASSDAPWTQVAEQTACEAMNPHQCRGVYGFTVTPDGHYLVGPADDGTTTAGSISDSERARLSGDAAQVAGSLGGSPVCEGTGSVPGVGDEVALTDARGAVWKVYELTLSGACTLGPRDAATRLHADLQALMASYYPRPFPK
jgi:hypothetical protein